MRVNEVNALGDDLCTVNNLFLLVALLRLGPAFKTFRQPFFDNDAVFLGTVCMSTQLMQSANFN